MKKAKLVIKKTNIPKKKGIVKIVGDSPAHEYAHIHIKDEPKLDRGLVVGSREHVKRWEKEVKEREQSGSSPSKENPSTKKPKDILSALEAKAGGVANDETILTFDINTNELILKKKSNTPTDDIIVDQIYKDGFFARKAA